MNGPPVAATITVEVACALPDRQYLQTLSVPAGCTAREAVARAELDERAPEVDLATAPLGIFGNELADPDRHALRDGDRVEVYRPLSLDPKEIRRRRAEKAKQRAARARRAAAAGSATEDPAGDRRAPTA